LTLYIRVDLLDKLCLSDGQTKLNPIAYSSCEPRSDRCDKGLFMVYTHKHEGGHPNTFYPRTLRNTIGFILLTTNNYIYDGNSNNIHYRNTLFEFVVVSFFITVQHLLAYNRILIS